MVSLPVIPPTGAPSCWGQKYQDGDVECDQCPFNDSCKKQVLMGAIRSPIYAQPQGVPMNQQVPFPRPMYPPSAPNPAPMPSPVYRPQAPIPQPAYPMSPQIYQQPQPVPVTAPYTPQQPLQAMLPREIPDPTLPWVRPGAGGSPYYFTQYPNESTVTRLGKNLVLKALAGALGELLSFIVQWTWPPSGGNNNRS